MSKIIKNYQDEIDEFFKREGWSYWSPLSQMARLSEEVGEVARILNDMHGDKPKKSIETKQHLDEELADVIYTVLCLANSHDINMDDAMSSVFEKISIRDKGRFSKND